MSASRAVFFSQAEDGIRDYKVTGVQTCALPIYQRLVDESANEAEAMTVLAKAPQIGASKAIDNAETIVDRRGVSTDLDALRGRVNELAEALFQSIGMQLSVAKYQAIDVGRGANLDELDVPPNNRVWLQHRFAELRRLENDAAKLRGI